MLTVPPVHQLRPLAYLKTYTEKYPHAWKTYENFFSNRGKDLPDWPSWCFCPLAGAYTVVSYGGELETSRIKDLAYIGALAAWRMTKGIYRFDPDFIKSLTETPFEGEIPGETLLHLPEWCVYLDLQNYPIGDIVGLFAHLEWDTKENHSEIRLVLDYNDPVNPLEPFTIHLGGTITQGIDATIKEGTARVFEKGLSPIDAGILSRNIDMEAIAKIIPLILYLCSDEPDIRNRQGKMPANPQPKSTKKGTKLFAALSPEYYETGFRLGHALRHYQSAVSHGGTVRPHIRRAHWHSFWIGPMSAQREIRIRWLPPIPVNLDTEVTPVIRNVH